MMRAMTLSEKHHGEEGLMTCRLRSVMGELLLTFCLSPSFPPLASPPLVLPPSPSSPASPPESCPHYCFQGDLFYCMGQMKDVMASLDKKATTEGKKLTSQEKLTNQPLISVLRDPNLNTPPSLVAFSTSLFRPFFAPPSRSPPGVVFAGGVSWAAGL